MAKDNKTIGKFHLDGIPPAPRGVPQIEVTFDIDSNGILNVSAKDKATNKEQSIRIEASSGLSDDEIEKMKREAEENADSDKEAKERIDKLNTADSLIFQTEKQLKEFGDKLPADKKEPIEEALADLKKAHEIAHGLTTFSANLIYERESGALNESFSDIFGAAIEFYARPNRANWLIGEDIGITIRSMDEDLVSLLELF